MTSLKTSLICMLLAACLLVGSVFVPRAASARTEKEADTELDALEDLEMDGDIEDDEDLDEEDGANDDEPRIAIPLWEGDAPYSNESPGQVPSLIPYERKKKTRIAVVICPGGAYTTLNGSHSLEKRLNRKGIAAYVLNYRIAPCNVIAPLTDVQRAIRMVRSKGYKYVGILGFSAGGHLACTAATHWTTEDPENQDPIDSLSCRPDFFVACYPVVSFWEYPQQRSVKNLLGEHIDEEYWLKFFSAELNVTPDTPPGYIWHCTDDKVVSVRHSILLGEALAEAGVFYELHIFPGGAHAIGLEKKKYPHIKSWAAECVAFIKLVCE